MGLELEYGPGQTALDEEEKAGLKITTITTRGELDEFEQLNIQKAVEWSLGKKWKAERLLSEAFLLELHKKMYGEVWSWAGSFRRTDKNIGVRYFMVGRELKMLLDDANYWINNQSYPPQEIAIRFKHRLVSIHCFPNGNGRHSRLMADIMISQIYGQQVYSWGNSALVRADVLRKTYIDALRSADRGEIAPLIDFAKS